MHIVIIAIMQIVIVIIAIVLIIAIIALSLAKQKQPGCKKVRGQSEATMVISDQNL